MKKSNLFLCLVLLLSFAGCESDMDLMDYSGQTITTRYSGDGIYDLLGHGYDCTFSDFKEARYSKAQVLDLERFKSGRGRDPITRQEVVKNTGNILEAGLNGATDTERFFGNNVLDYSKDVERNTTAKLTLEAGEILPMFTAELKNYVKTQDKFSSKHVFYRVNSVKYTRKLTMSNIYPEYLKYFFTDEFLNDLNDYNGDQLVAKYGTHVITDIMLGGLGTMIFNSKMNNSTDYQKFRDEADITFGAITSHSHEETIKNLFKDNKDVSISIKTTGGSEAISANLSFNPMTGEIGGFDSDFRSWMNSVNRQTEQIIGIGNNTTKVYFLSDFVDDPVKKKNIEDAIRRYANSQKITVSNIKNIDFEDGYIASYYPIGNHLKTYLCMTYGGSLPASIPPYLNRCNQNDVKADFFHGVWTFLKEGDYYRIGCTYNPKGETYYMDNGDLLMGGYSQNRIDQLFEIERLSNDKYMIKSVANGMYLGIDLTQLHPYNPNNSGLWFKIDLLNE